MRLALLLVPARQRLVSCGARAKVQRREKGVEMHCTDDQH
jgi:hypothetical protein